MTSALLLSSGGSAPPLLDDLQAVGIEVAGLSDCSRMMQDVMQIRPDLLVCFEHAPDAAFFEAFAAIAAVAARPTVIFTDDPDAENIVLAARTGIHAYVVAGYSRNRLRSVVHLAQARFRQEALLRTELAELQKRFDERKLVDRAKGILMGARQLREDEAFRSLRNAAMASKQRIGQVSQIVIDSARYAEAVNRAGQLRMLSQRLVKLYVLICAGTAARESANLFADSIGQVESILSILERLVSKPTFGDLLAAVQAPWERLRVVLRAPGRVGQIGKVDSLAEELLDHAERLTANLEVAAYATALRVINVAGRQRMLSQRLAKEALIAAIVPADPGTVDPDALDHGADDDTAGELARGLDYLSDLPLSNADIVQELERTKAAWAAFQPALAHCGTAPGREQVAEASEALLGHFDRLTDLFERAMQTLVG